MRRVMFMLIAIITLASCVNTRSSKEPLAVTSIEANISSKGYSEDPGDTKAIGIKIGLVADSQITSLNEVSFLTRSKLADSLVNVAVRTPAQEYLARDHLRIMLSDLLENNVDIILYLGDGSNSGCKDEVDDFFMILSETQQSKPIFYVIGNHDYMSTGNSTKIKDRKAACSKNGLAKFYNKKELIEITSAFNKKSYQNFKGEGILESYDDSLNFVKNACTLKKTEKLHSENCFYAGKISYSTKNDIKGDILLVDTSDYADVKILPRIFNSEFFGVRGGISFSGNNAQTKWFQSKLNDTKDRVRILASHYPQTNLNYSGRYSQRPGDLLSIYAENNIWLSGHTHNSNINLKLKRFSYNEKNTEITKNLVEYNVGSTTDYWPHVAVIEDQDNRSNIYSYPTITNFSECHFMNDIYSTITPENGYVSVLNSENNYGSLVGDMALGITKFYQHKAWSNKDTLATRSNIDMLLKKISSEKKDKAIRCMIFKASLIESELEGVIH